MASHPKFVLKKAKNDDYYFVLTAKNGQIIAQSEMYKSKAAAQNGIASVKENAPAAETEDESAAA
tara:strand:+ start:2770 stop:2964 length:195 start_codon:yes stop_codon:yes gene_type:complete